MGVQGALVLVERKEPKGRGAAEDPLVLLERRVLMVSQDVMATQAPADSQETRVLPEIQVHQVQEETRDRTGFPDLQERKGPWEPQDLDLEAQRDIKELQAVWGTGAPLAPVDPLDPQDKRENRVV